MGRAQEQSLISRVTEQARAAQLVLSRRRRSHQGHAAAGVSHVRATGAVPHRPRGMSERRRAELRRSDRLGGATTVLEDRIFFGPLLRIETGEDRLINCAVVSVVDNERIGFGDDHCAGGERFVVRRSRHRSVQLKQGFFTRQYKGSRSSCAAAILGGVCRGWVNRVDSNAESP
jgi:hypothetical protein